MPSEPLDDVMRRVISYDRSQVVSEYRALARELAGYPPVLDIGCGSGTLLETLGRLGVKSQGVDASASAVAACRQRGSNAEQADLVDFLTGTSDAAYGAVFAGHVIEHLPPDSARAVYAQVSRVLRTGGRFVVLTPNPRNLYVAGEGFWIDPTHVRPYPEPLLRALALDAGFSSVRVRRWRRGMPVRQLVSGTVRWLATAGLHDIAPSLLSVATK
jgi:2-polyprenyl-3-methyl-5-hydroxy-6-metoxy-1,4-benzoquinol methylase